MAGLPSWGTSFSHACFGIHGHTEVNMIQQAPAQGFAVEPGIEGGAARQAAPTAWASRMVMSVPAAGSGALSPQYSN